MPAIIILAASVSATADVRDLPVKEINGRRYYYYQVKPKDTFFSLTRALGVSRSEIEKYNPTAVDGLKAYATLYFPVESFGTAESDTVTEAEDTPAESPDSNSGSDSPRSALETDGTLYKIQKGQSLYGIAYANNISVDDLLAANPGIDPKGYKA